ncbi:hypothetical protein JYB87_14085 [Shewanella avicenniae]|uniref:Uncharacterized protein n=1 Tax=Shewanella avicenniae TaxID=2814294 RepID=A0ABX7QN37_9GAMM|nr:hypothetical protein [Shewanella avicenniae]QSX32864.1 hypothetical protein JYB87_14085 [Shewanella avicenniae]
MWRSIVLLALQGGIMSAATAATNAQDGLSSASEQNSQTQQVQTQETPAQLEARLQMMELKNREQELKLKAKELKLKEQELALRAQKLKENQLEQKVAKEKPSFAYRFENESSESPQAIENKIKGYISAGEFSRQANTDLAEIYVGDKTKVFDYRLLEKTIIHHINSEDALSSKVFKKKPQIESIYFGIGRAYWAYNLKELQTSEEKLIKGMVYTLKVFEDQKYKHMPLSEEENQKIVLEQNQLWDSYINGDLEAKKAIYLKFKKETDKLDEMGKGNMRVLNNALLVTLEKLTYQYIKTKKWDLVEKDGPKMNIFSKINFTPSQVSELYEAAFKK